MESQYLRLDRIEREIEAFLKGMSELRAAQLTTDKQIADLRAAQLKTDEQIADLRDELRTAQLKTDEQLNKTEKMLKNVTKQLADIGLVQGEVAEDLFYRNTKTLFQKRGMRFPKVIRNLKKKGVAEYDIVAAGGDDVLVHQ